MTVLRSSTIVDLIRTWLQDPRSAAEIARCGLIRRSLIVRTV